MSDTSGPPDPALHDPAGRDARLALRGSCDGGAAARHRDRVRDLLELGPAALVVDLGRPRRLSSDMVGLLLWLHRTCVERGVVVVVTGPPRRGVDPLMSNGVLAPGPRPGREPRRRRRGVPA